MPNHLARLALVCVLGLGLHAHALELNSANEAELDSIRGMGPAMTQRVLLARSQAPFLDWPDFVRRVKGVRTATAQQFSQQGVTVNGRTLGAVDTAPQTGRPAAP